VVGNFTILLKIFNGFYCAILFYTLIRLLIYKNYILISGERVVIRERYYSYSFLIEEIKTMGIKKNYWNSSFLKLTLNNGKKIKIYSYLFSNKDFIHFTSLLKEKIIVGE
jgi:hypothetical protein